MNKSPEKVAEELAQKKAKYDEVMDYLIKHTEMSSKFYAPICDYVKALESNSPEKLDSWISVEERQPEPPKEQP